jgi:V8-like Glu-specific endopeptidase
MVGGCQGGTITGPPAEATADIIGGSVDTGDSSVVIVFAQENGSSQGSLCTASVIAPTVLLTAAHCVSPAEVGSDVTFHVFTGYDFNSNNGNWLDVAKVDWDHQFDPNSLDGGHDVGIVVLAKPVSLAPLPYLRSAADALTGAVRLVGYGNNNGRANSGAGIKRQVTTSLNDVTSKLLQIGDNKHETCNGDSGGPAFMNVNGVETIVGVTSFGQVGCTGGGYDTRLDLYTRFIDGYVQAAGGGTTGGGNTGGGTTGGGDTGGGTTGGGNTGGGDTGGGTTGGGDTGGGTTGGGSCDWEQEPNDSASQANAVCADGHIYGAIDQPGDVDWYTFTVQPGQSYYVDLSTLPEDYNFTVYKVSGNYLYPIATADDWHDLQTQEVARSTSTGGTYYVKVFGVNGASDSQYGYTLTIHN